jgi:hypothetical protein
MFLREAKDATAAEREGAEAGLFAAKAVCGEVVVRVDVEGATIFIDGDEEGVAPLPDAVYLTPGSHELEARKDGKSAKTSVTAKAGEAGEVRIRLKNARAAASAPGDSEPEHGDTSLPPEYDTASSDGGREGFFPWFGHTPLAWVGGGLAVVGVAGGVGFGLSAKQSYDDADAQAEEIRSNAVDDGATNTQGICLDPRSVAGLQDETMTRIAQYHEACSNHQDDVANGDRMKTFSMISWAVAGAATVGTIIYYFADAEDEAAQANAAQRPRVAAVVGPGYLGLQGSF